MIPLVHDFTGETVLVFGGGTVGTRKARRFAREARVLVVSPAFSDTLHAIARTHHVGDVTEWEWTADSPGIELVETTPAAADVGAWVERVAPALVVAATDDEAVNEAVTAVARERGVLVNRTDRAGARDVGSVVVPATVEDGSVSVAITTGGASPALSKYLRERLEAELAGAGAMADLTRELRTEFKERDLSPNERRDAVRRVVRSPAVWKALRSGDSNARRVAEHVLSSDQEPNGGEP